MTINEAMLDFWVNYPLGAFILVAMASGTLTKGMELIVNWKNNKKKSSAEIVNAGANAANADANVAAAAMALVNELQEEIGNMKGEIGKMRDERRRFTLENDEIVKTSDKLKHAVELCLETLEEKGADTLEIDRIRALGG